MLGEWVNGCIPGGADWIKRVRRAERKERLVSGSIQDGNSVELVSELVRAGDTGDEETKPTPRTGG